MSRSTWISFYLLCLLAITATAFFSFRTKAQSGQSTAYLTNPAMQYFFAHITGTSAVAVKATGGFLHTVTINTPGIGTLKLFDLAAASCTGTPSTNTIGSVNLGAAALPGTFIYDSLTTNGICVQASIAMDVTVSYQ